MNKLWVVLFAFFTHVASAQVGGGAWINNALNAFDRIHVTKNGTVDDANEMGALMFYVLGVLAVHRENNLKALLVFDVIRGSGPKPSDDAQIRTLLLFTPLRKLPDKLPEEQIAAVLRKYLVANPGKWNDPPLAIVNAAFADAFGQR